ncbi:hypothetical protein QJQ45_005897 [Haematococcus lacustris]|nr:hypothetical protein QJQ45_005897 [Haematococcus lacustris]
MSLVAQCLRGSGPVPRSKSRFRLKARENESSELRAAHIAAVHASAGPSTPPGKQREERRAEWKTQRRQVRTGAHTALYAPALFVSPHRTTRVSSAVNGQQPSWSQQRDQPVRGMMWCPVVAPCKPPQAPRSSQAATQAAASEPGPSTPLPAKRSKRTKAEPEAAEPSQPTQGKGKAQGKAAKAKPAPQPGRWVDRDCNAALNMQRIGESKWRPLELCWWPEQGKLPAKGKEYPGLGYKRLRDKPPKAQQQQPAVAQ